MRNESEMNQKRFQKFVLNKSDSKWIHIRS